MSESEMEGKDGIVNGDVEAERVRFENQRMTRRQALRKFGFMAGMTVFATLSIDDLARIAARKLQETEMTKGIGDTLAKEFRDAGVALAAPDGGDPYGNFPPGGYYYVVMRPPCSAAGDTVDCQNCCDDRKTARDKACYAKYSPNGECGTWPNPEGNPGCVDFNVCIGASAESATTCNETC